MSDEKSASGSEPVKLPSPPEGFSQFVSRVLDQLSLSSWLPAALLVSTGAVILELRSQEEIDVAQAVIDLTAKPLGILIVVIFALLTATMLLQAFELTAIRILEGYWPPIASSLGLTGMMVRIHLARRDALQRRLIKRRVRAFRAAREVLLDAGTDQAVLEYHRVSAAGETFAVRPTEAVVAAAEALDWRPFAPASRLRSYESVERSLNIYPKPHRTMPTKLGNTLRAGEDGIRDLGHGTLRTFVIRHWHLLPREIQVLHDEYRNRLDLYCTLVFVCAAIAAGGGALLWTAKGGAVAGWVVFAVFLASAVASYRAAITSAVGYTGALHAIDTHVGAAKTEAAQPTRKRRWGVPSLRPS